MLERAPTTTGSLSAQNRPEPYSDLAPEPDVADEAGVGAIQ